MSETIKVVVRVRPMNTKEKERGCLSIVSPDEANNQISIRKPEEEDNIKSFAFDSVFNEASEQGIVYEKTAFKLVESVIEGYNGTIFAYGQTGCGKTHSMVGKLQEPELHGIIPRSFKHILNVVAEAPNKEFLIRCSFIEIYNEEVHDLLSKDVKAKLDVKESPEKGIFIKDLSMNAAKTYNELMNFMNIGNKNRSVGETLMNKDSSRSHSIFMLFIETAEKSPTGEDRYVAGKLNLVDLAGSERISKTGAAGDRLKEAQKINLSLSALGNVISALVDGKTQHIPYRDSKLTRLLQDSLGGNTKTVMIANCSPADYNFDETLSTLRYASRAKFIKNKPVINEDPKDALLKEYAEQIKRLKQMLENGDTGRPLGHISPTSSDNTHHEQQENEFRQQLQLKEQQLSKEKDERLRLEEKIRALEAQHLQAKDITPQANEINQIHRIRESLMKQAVKTIVAPGAEEDTIAVEGLKQDQLQNFKKLIKKQKQKIKSLECDLKDINYENYKDKEELLEEIRSLNKETKMQSCIMSMLLTKEELEIIKSACEYRDESQEYKVPPFYFKSKKLVFPKVCENQALDIVRQFKDNRELVLEKKEEVISRENRQTSIRKTVDKDKENGEYSLNTVLKNAKVNTNVDKSRQRTSPSKKEKAPFATANLSPIVGQRPMLPPNEEGLNPEPKLLRKGQLSPLRKQAN